MTPMIHVYSKMVSLLMAFAVVMALGYSWDYLTERPRHRKLDTPTEEDK